MHLFYIENPETINYDTKHIILSGEEAFHATKVLRLNIGAKVEATDGQGNWFDCTIEEIHKRQCLLKITNHITEKGKRNYKLHIAIAPTKNIKRFEWFLEKATEMGIDEITPIITSNSERRVMKIERSNKVLTAAMKQSLKAYHPVLNNAMSFNSFMENSNEESLFIAHLINDNQIDLKTAYQKNTNVCILIGPEGDFSDKEMEQAISKGFRAVKMGNERLRTETAGIVACSCIHFVND